MNPYKYSCFMNITCELTKFDDPTVETTGEEVFLMKRGANCSSHNKTNFSILWKTINKTL